jgi:hypothetical protein
MTRDQYLALRRDALENLERWRGHLRLLDSQWARQESEAINAQARVLLLPRARVLEKSLTGADNGE